MVSSLSLGTPVAGNLTFNGELDAYTVPLTGGTTYTFDLVSPNIQDLSLVFTDATGKVDPVSAPVVNSAANIGNVQGYTFTPPTTGTYTAHVSSASLVSHGSYQIIGTATPTVLVFDTTANKDITAATPDIAYVGPVTSLQTECVYLGPHNVNMTALTPNEFLHSGSGQDAIQVLGGQNVLDGGTGSNFLVGGNGNDTFFDDARGTNTITWDTLVNFHTGDNATVWGNVTRWHWIGNAGAASFKGPTLEAQTSQGGAALVTFAGDSQSQLHVSTGSAGGNPYLNVSHS